MRTRCLLLVACLASVALAAPPKPRVSFEVVTRSGIGLTSSQQWYRILSDLGIEGLQIRPGAANDEVKVTQIGTDKAPHYRVVAILSADNLLYLPGGKFTSGDTAKLRKWIDTLVDQGPDVVTQPGGAFGLIPRQLDEVNADLKRKVDFATRDLPAADAVDRIGRRLKLPLEIDAAAARELAAVRVADELEGLASGTALAAAVRPAGLALMPERVGGGKLQYRITKAQAGREAWPIGWPPKERPVQLLPILFETLNVEIKDTPVSEGLDAIRERLEVPFLFDRNAMALHGVDPAQVMADVSTKRLSYSQILNRILMQSKLKYELRTDDAGSPFLWITTVKPAG